MIEFACETPELLLAYAKDAKFVDRIVNSLKSVFASFFKPPNVVCWGSEIAAFGEFLYYILTTLSGLQTIGEEYVGILQYEVNAAGQKVVPKRSKQLFFILAKVGTPVLFAKLSRNIRRSDRCRELRPLLELLLRLFSTFFFVNFLRFAKRCFGINYLSLNSHTSPETVSVFRALGLISLFGVLVNAGLQLYSFYYFRSSTPKVSCHLQGAVGINNQSANQSLLKKSKRTFRCLICLDDSCNAFAATLCGHVFCWDCVLQSESCALCRQPLDPSEAIALLNL